MRNTKARIIDMLESGLEPKQIAKKLKVSNGWIAKVRNEIGMRPFARGPKPKISKKLFQFFERGVPQSKAAKLCHCSRAYVSIRYGQWRQS